MADQMQPKTISANGAEFQYVERGTGEPVIFVHGSLGDYRTWAPQLEAFSGQYHAIAYSRRYHNPNPWSGPGTDYTPAHHAEDLAALVEALRIAPANVVGNSFGAYTALVAGIRHPGVVRRLVIGEPPVLPWLKVAPGGQVLFDTFMANAWLPATEAFRTGELEQGVRLFVDGISGAGAFDHIPGPVKNRMMENARSLQAETQSPDYFTEITPGQLRQVRAPVLLLKGANSEKMFHLVVDELAKCLPGSRVATIPDAGHSLPSNNPPAYNQAVLEFLKMS